VHKAKNLQKNLICISQRYKNCRLNNGKYKRRKTEKARQTFYTADKTSQANAYANRAVSAKVYN